MMTHTERQKSKPTFHTSSHKALTITYTILQYKHNAEYHYKAEQYPKFSLTAIWQTSP